MISDSLKLLHNYDNAIEAAARSVLVANGYGDSFIQGNSSDLPPSRIEVLFATGEAMNEAVLANGDHVYDYFAGRLTIRIVTMRPDDQPSLISGVSTMHSEFAGAVRAIFEERAKPFTSVNLPLYSVKVIRPAGTRRDLDPKWLEDFTELSFAVEFGIRSESWGVSAPA